MRGSTCTRKGQVRIFLISQNGPMAGDCSDLSNHRRLKPVPPKRGGPLAKFFSTTLTRLAMDIFRDYVFRLEFTRIRRCGAYTHACIGRARWKSPVTHRRPVSIPRIPEKNIHLNILNNNIIPVSCLYVRMLWQHSAHLMHFGTHILLKQTHACIKRNFIIIFRILSYENIF